jgi:serine/threonine-protein kinase
MTDGADPRAQQRVGSVLNEKWTLEHLIGTGGMGAVYAARHRNGARAAVKILHPELARIAEVRERFLREGYAANSVEHRGAVQVLDDDIVKGGVDEGSAYLVMELLEGESLQERAQRSPKLGERELLEVMDAVLDVLAAAHEHGVIHRDLKPENIFLAHDPEREGVRVKVLDFGLARLAEASTVTSAGIAVGTPSFMSPEQAAGRSDEIDGRTDIFALGATIFRIVTGRRIHDAENMVQLVLLMATVPAPRLRSIAPDVSEGFAHVIDRALAFERADRYPDAATMGADVRAALEMGGVRGSAATLQVIPFSARNVRVASAIDLPEMPVDAPRPRANTNPEPEVANEDDERASESPVPAQHGRAIARSATLPWVLVLFLLTVGIWKLGPSLQEELVRRSSFEPVRKLWSTPSASASGALVAPSDTADPTAADTATPDVDASGTLDMDEDAGSIAAEDPSPDAGEPAPLVEEPAPHDAGPSHAMATRPRPSAHPPNKPPAKKPPAKKPPPQQQRKR